MRSRRQNFRADHPPVSYSPLVPAQDQTNTKKATPKAVLTNNKKGVNKKENWGWAGTPDIVAEYKRKVVLGDLKTSNGPYYARWPGKDTPRNVYGMQRAGFMKYSKCQMQMAAYALALEHTVNIKPELIMTFVATKDRSQVFVIQGSTINKYKEKWLNAVEKYYTEILPTKETSEVEMEAIDEDKKTSACPIN